MYKYCKNSIVAATVTGITKYGIFVRVDDKYNGLIHISELANHYVTDVGQFAKQGERIYARVVNFDKDSEQFCLSIKNIEYLQSTNSGRKISLKIRQPIVETGDGFETISRKLDGWISEKIKEMKKKPKNF